MAAITWQNINGPSLSEAARPLEAAQRSMASMFSGFDDILKKREATQVANWDQSKLNNTNALLGAVQEAKTPEEYAAKEAQLREQMLGYGAQVDSVAARNALDSRMSTLQQRSTANQQYTDQQTDVAGRPIAAGYQSALAQATKPEAVRSLMESIQTATGAGAIDARLATALTEKAVSRSAALTAEERATTTFANQQSNQAHQVAMQPGALAIQEENLAALKQANVAKSQSSGLNQLLLQHNKGYQSDISTWNNNVKAIGLEMKLPVNAATGMPDITKASPEALQAFKAKIGSPPSSTERLSVFEQQMNDANVPLEDRVKARDLFDKSFGTGAVISDVDKKNLDTKIKQFDERIASKKKSSLLYSGTQEEKDAETLATQEYYDSKQKDTWFVKNHREFVKNTMQSGLVFKDDLGREQTATVTPKMMKLALSASMDRDSNLWNSTEGQVTAYLKDYIASPEYAKEVIVDGELRADPTGNIGRKKIIDSFSRPTMGTGPVQYMNALTDNIDSAYARSQLEASEAQKKTR